MKIAIIMFLAYFAVITILVTLCVYKGTLRAVNDKKLKKTNIDSSEEKLFDHWAKKTYYSLTKKRPEYIAKKIGINAEKYYKNCNITKIVPDLEGAVVKSTLSFITAIYSLVVGAVSGIWYISAIASLIFFLFALFPIKRMDDSANRIRTQIIEEMPRFLDMMQTALYINLPVEEAIKITAKHLKGTVLADEFSMTMAEMQMGVYDWQSALEQMSQKYEIDIFSDFVLDIVTAYDKGIPIYDVVVRENKEIKQTNLLTLKENASKLNSTILLPITLFKLIPLIAIIGIPIVMQLRGSGIL